MIEIAKQATVGVGAGSGLVVVGRYGQAYVWTALECLEHAADGNWYDIVYIHSPKGTWPARVMAAAKEYHGRPGAALLLVDAPVNTFSKQRFRFRAPRFVEGTPVVHAWWDNNAVQTVETTVRMQQGFTAIMVPFDGQVGGPCFADQRRICLAGILPESNPRTQAVHSMSTILSLIQREWCPR